MRRRQHLHTSFTMSQTFHFWASISLHGLPTARDHKLGGFSSRHFFSYSPGGLKSKSKIHWDWVLVRPLFLACRWSPSHCVLMWPFACVHMFRESSLLPLPLYEGPTLKTSFNLHYPPKDPVSCCCFLIAKLYPTLLQPHGL